MIDKLIKAVKNPRTALLVLWGKTNTDKLSDEKFLKTKFHLAMGKKLDLENPQTFNEKLQWIKLYDRNPLYTKLVDKYLVRDYIKEVLGEEYLIPLIGAWDSPDEIDFDALPDKFVLKCNHNSGLGMCICKDKSKLDIEKVKEELRKGMAQDYYLTQREWPYKDVPRKIIAEEFMIDNSGVGLRDYKFFCFNGEPKFLYLSEGLDNHDTAAISFLTLDWKQASYERCDYKPFKVLPEKPSQFDKMVEIAKKLSSGFDFLRVDLYEINGRVYFSELTLFTGAGFTPFKDEASDYEIGSMLKLSGLENGNK